MKRVSFSGHLKAKVSYLKHLGTFWPQIFAVTSSLLKMPVFTLATFLPQLPNEPVMRRITTDKATKRTRQILSETEWVSLDLHWICNTWYILFWSQPLKFKICCVLKTFYTDVWNIYVLLILIANSLLTASEVFKGKISQTQTQPYWPSNSKGNTARPRFEIFQ